MLSDHIAVEYGPQGVRRNTLMPGVIGASERSRANRLRTVAETS
jgi:NAD(P)-dependent dehydrogenase (short-subunit alcohol dehydrogenase family)